jgi:hypothetical protein
MTPIPEWMERFLSAPFCFDCPQKVVDVYKRDHPCHADGVCHQYASVRPELPYMTKPKMS